MLRHITLLLVACTLFYACKPLDERMDPNPAEGLAFSDDSIFFDTVFTQQKTVTLRLLIYNPNPKTITLEQVSMRGGAESPFLLTVNGRTGIPIQNVEILGNDSAYVLIAGRLPATMQDLPLVIDDIIDFRIKGRAEVQSIPVKAKGQDAIYLDGVTVRSDSTIHADKPVVIFGSLFVAPGVTLTIEAGARIHLYNSTYLIVQGTLLVNGTCDHPVRFSGTRLEPRYALVPEQWGYIALLPPSSGNQIHYALIENGLRGVQLNIPDWADSTLPVDLLIDNSFIRNVSDVGLYSFGGAITGYNNVLADCGGSYINGAMGGTYNFAHNTIGQSGNTPFNRKVQAVVFSAYFQATSNDPILSSITGPPIVNFYNNIVSGTTQGGEFLLVPPTTINTVPVITAIDTSHIQNNLISGLPRSPRGSNIYLNGFGYPNAESFYSAITYDFHADSASPGQEHAAGFSLPTLRNTVPAFANLPGQGLFLDAACKSRDQDRPNIGAFEPK